MTVGLIIVSILGVAVAACVAGWLYDVHRISRIARELKLIKGRIKELKNALQSIGPWCTLPTGERVRRYESVSGKPIAAWVSAGGGLWIVYGSAGCVVTSGMSDDPEWAADRYLIDLGAVLGTSKAKAGARR